MRGRGLLGLGLLAIAGGTQAADLSSVLPRKAPPSTVAPYDWTGFTCRRPSRLRRGRIQLDGDAGWAASPSLSGSLAMFEGYNFSNGGGSYLLGFQAGYNYMFPSRLVLGAEADISFPSVLGASQAIASPLIGKAIYRDQVEMSGTVRGRVGYAAAQWLFYATRRLRLQLRSSRPYSGFRRRRWRHRRGGHGREPVPGAADRRCGWRWR